MMHERGEISDQAIAIRQQEQYDMEGITEQGQSDQRADSLDQQQTFSNAVLKRHPILLDNTYPEENSARLSLSSLAYN